MKKANTFINNIWNCTMMAERIYDMFSFLWRSDKWIEKVAVVFLLRIYKINDVRRKQSAQFIWPK